MAIRYLPVSWKTYHETARKLAATVLNHTEPIDQIVAISRGGLTLGHLLTDFLRIPISIITIQSYTDIQASGEAVLTAKLQNSIKHKHILLVDDVSDSGKTMKRATKYLTRAGAKKITTVTMFYKPRSILRPDYFAKQTTKWILFPYEPTEMILLITKQMVSDGKSKADIQQFLKKLAYTDDQITFVRRHYIDEKQK
ncbi:MAG: phosphoribosyltransferase family protein [Candidatus Gottesmanbacteria bacterium]|nr:phosphoribosyltransferase family protein [Candidatus Gottesmanbacteria bacterium]